MPWPAIILAIAIGVPSCMVIGMVIHAVRCCHDDVDDEPYNQK